MGTSEIAGTYGALFLGFKLSYCFPGFPCVWGGLRDFLSLLLT